MDWKEKFIFFSVVLMLLISPAIAGGIFEWFFGSSNPVNYFIIQQVDMNKVRVGCDGNSAIKSIDNNVVSCINVNAGSSVDLSAYYSKSEVDAMIKGKTVLIRVNNSNDRGTANIYQYDNVRTIVIQKEFDGIAGNNFYLKFAISDEQWIDWINNRIKIYNIYYNHGSASANSGNINVMTSGLITPSGENRANISGGLGSATTVNAGIARYNLVDYFLWSSGASYVSTKVSWSTNFAGPKTSDPPVVWGGGVDYVIDFRQ